MTTEIILAWATSTWNNALLPCFPRLADVQATKEEAQIRVKFVGELCDNNYLTHCQEHFLKTGVGRH